MCFISFSINYVSTHTNDVFLQNNDHSCVFYNLGFLSTWSAKFCVCMWMPNGQLFPPNVRLFRDVLSCPLGFPSLSRVWHWITVVWGSCPHNWLPLMVRNFVPHHQHYTNFGAHRTNPGNHSPRQSGRHAEETWRIKVVQKYERHVDDDQPKSFLSAFS